RLSHYQGIAEARCFAELVLGALAELKQAKISPAAFSAAAEEVPEQQLADLYAAYHCYLREHNLYDTDGRAWYAGELLHERRGAPWERIRIAFVDGFPGFTRLQQDLLNALAGFVEELWITLPGEAGEDRAELWTRPRSSVDALNGA